MSDIKIIKFQGEFDFPVDTPFILHQMPDNKLGFELVPEASFTQLLKDTPECNDFRQLANGDWVAYSTVLEESGDMIRAIDTTIWHALTALRKKLNYAD